MLEPKNAEPEPIPTTSAATSAAYGGNGNAHNAFDLLLPMMRKMWAEWQEVEVGGGGSGRRNMGATTAECTLPSTANMSSSVVQLVPQQKALKNLLLPRRRESPFARFTLTHARDESVTGFVVGYGRIYIIYCPFSPHVGLSFISNHLTPS